MRKFLPTNIMMNTFNIISKCLCHLQMMIIYFQFETIPIVYRFPLVYCSFSGKYIFIFVVRSYLRHCCYGNSIFGGYKEGYCMVTPSRLPQCNMIGAGGGVLVVHGVQEMQSMLKTQYGTLHV